MKPVFLRTVAERFFGGELDRLVDKVEERTAAGMATALGKLKNAISAHPGSGSPRYANLLDVPGLRHRKLGRYRYLHANMDILNRLRDPDAPGEGEANDA